jgi:hypothetical protein
MKRLLAIAILASLLAGPGPSQADHLDRWCTSLTLGLTAGQGPSCTLTLECERATPGVCAWHGIVAVQAVGAGTGLVSASMEDAEEREIAGCFGTPTCEGTTRQHIAVPDGQTTTVTCASKVIGADPRLSCRAEQRLP